MSTTDEKLVPVKISDLPAAESIEGLYTIGCSAPGLSVKVGLDFISDTIQQSVQAAESAAEQAGVLAASKVDAVPGKGLSANDYTDADKALVAAIPTKGETEITYTSQVNTPVWTSQPTIEGELNAAFVALPEDFYFVTLKAADGEALPDGQFRLTPSLDTTYNADPAKAIDQLFTLPGLNTGNSGLLKESLPVDFTAVGADWRMRSGGVEKVIIKIDDQYRQGYDMQVNSVIKLSRIYYAYYHPFEVVPNYTDFFGYSCVGSGYNIVGNGFLFPPHTFTQRKHNTSIETFILRRIPSYWTVEYTRGPYAHNGTLSNRTEVLNNQSYTQSVNGYGFSVNPANPIEALPLKDLQISYASVGLLNGSSIKLTLIKRT